MLFDKGDEFLGQLANVIWWALVVAVVLHLATLVLRARAWRNIIDDAYPELRVGQRGILGAYVAGVGVNSVVPARLGDVVKLFLAKRSVEGSSYATLISTFVVFSVVDILVSSVIVIWALQLGVLPGIDELRSDPNFAGAWIVANPVATAGLAVAFLAAVVLLLIWGSRHVVAFKRRLVRGFAVLSHWRYYARHVLSWQLGAWVLQVASLGWFLAAFGLAATSGNTFVVQAMQSLAQAVPFTASGAGAEQALLVAAFDDEMPAADVLGFAVGLRIAIAGSNVLVGFAAILVMLRTLRFRRIVAPERAKLAKAHAALAEGRRAKGR